MVNMVNMGNMVGAAGAARTDGKVGAVARFFPDERVATLFDIDLARLWAHGARGLIFDVDNTLAPAGETKADEKTVAWLMAARIMGFALCALSNSKTDRSRMFQGVPGMGMVSGARKPSRAGFWHALKRLGVAPGQACMIGDQLFTDVYGARRLGIHTILVNPVALREELFVRIKRLPERFLLWLYRRDLARRA